MQATAQTERAWNMDLGFEQERELLIATSVTQHIHDHAATKMQPLQQPKILDLYQNPNCYPYITLLLKT